MCREKLHQVSPKSNRGLRLRLVSDVDKGCPMCVPSTKGKEKLGLAGALYKLHKESNYEKEGQASFFY